MGDLVYGEYDQESLDLQYDMRRRIPDHMDWFNRLKVDSERMVAELDCAIDVPFGPTQGQKLDIFKGQPGGPVHMFIHGGYWRAFDKDMFRYIAEPFVAKGVTLVLNNYDLCPHVTMDEILRQNRAAIAWLYANIAGYGGDPGQITVSGHSAGGHLTAMLCSTQWAPFDCPQDVIRAGCAISGLMDLEPLRRAYLNADLHMDEATAKRNSPVHCLPESAPPQIIAVGGGETDEFLRQSRDYAQMWRAKGLPDGRYLPIKDVHHVAVSAELQDAQSPLTQAIFEQIGVA